MAPLAQWVLLLSSVAGLHGFRSLPTPVESANRLAGLLSAAKQYSSCRVRDPSIGRPFWHQRATRLWDAKQPSEGLDSVDPLDSLDQQILISLTARGAEVFDAVSGSEISKENVLQWEKKLREIATEIKMLKNQKILLSTYSSILKRAAPIELDPLQLTTFQIISQAVVDALLVIFPSNTPVTDLIDQLTDVHLNFIDQFQGIIDDGGDEEYSQSSRQEFLCYQFAGLARSVYERLSVSLGADFDNAAATQELRVTNWVSPVYARLQRRFVRFLSSNVDEKTEEMNDASFNRLLERVPLKINPRYQLSGPLDTAVYSEVTENSEGRVYPPWDLTDFYMKILRNTVQCINPLTLEARVVTQLRNDLSSRMRSLSKHLERIYEESPTFLPEKDLKRVEEMLNIGQESVAAVLTIWQIRYNVVGTEGKNGERLKDFIMPASIRGKNTKAAYECIPVSSRGFVKADVDAVSSRLSPSPELLAAAVLSYALRETAGEDLRALVTYNSDSYDWPSSRDAVYVAVLSSVLVEALASPTQFNHMWLYENLVAMAALEETVGVREPRSSCIEGFENALVTVAMQLLQNKAAIPADMNSRVMEVEKALGMVLRFPEDQGIKSRTKAFKQTINKIISSSERQTGSSGMKEVEKEYEWISKMMLLDPQQAKNYIMPMRQSKFDKTAGQLLLNSDVVVSVPGLDRIFNEQMQTLAADLMIPTDEANERIGYIAGAVFESLIETAIQEHRRMNTPKFDAIMKRACKLFQHPLLLSLPPKQADSPSLQEIGMTMVIARLGTSAIMELVRILEETKLRALDQKKKLSMLDNPSAFSSAGGWGGSDLAVGAGATDDSLQEYMDFLTAFQSFLLKQFAAGSIKRGYSS